MRRLFYSGMIVLQSALTVLFAQQQQEKVINATLISSTSTYKNLPYDIFSGKVWEADPNEKYVRLDMLFDKPAWIGEVWIEFNNDNSGAVVVYLDDLDNTYSKSYTSKAIIHIHTSPKEVSSVKFNFGNFKGIAIKSIYLKDTTGQKYRIQTSTVVEGSAQATSTLEPSRFYDISKLFDSKIESGWSSNKRSTGDTLTFNFDKEQTIYALKIWNGYQRSKVHYQSNCRAKVLRILGNSGYIQTVTLKDTINFQDVKLSQPFFGNQIKIIIAESYKGSKYSDVVISELRFTDEKDSSFLINPISKLREQIQFNRTQFTNSKIEKLLDNETGSSLPEDGPAEQGSTHIFRFRSDGSLYAEEIIEGGPKARKSFVIGNYEIVKSTEKGMDLRIFGYLVSQNGRGKYVYGADCGGYAFYEYNYKEGSKRIFTEFVTIKNIGIDTVESIGVYHRCDIINTGTVKNFDFDTLRLFVSED